VPGRAHEAGGGVVKIALAALVLLGLWLPATAALPPLSPEELAERADLVITGEVLASRVLVHRKPSSSMYLIRLGVLVESVEKGDDLIGEAKSLDIRCWKMRKTSLAGPSGHEEIPADASRFRMWLRQNDDGQWEPLEPNGIELLDGSPAITFAEVENRELGKGYLVGGIIGLLLLGVIVWFRLAK